jgi:hypothetical protein
MSEFLNYYDYNQFVPDRILRTVHKQATKSLPEIGALQNVLMPGTSYKTPLLQSEGDAPIFRNIGQGALSSRSDWTMVPNETYGIDYKVEAVLRAENESDAESQFGRETRFNMESEIRLRKAFERIVKQLYLGTAHETEGFGGFAEAAAYKFDALNVEWNEAKTFAVTTDFSSDQASGGLYSVFLVFNAEAPTVEAEGAKWLWGNNRTISPSPGNDGRRRIVDLDDPNGGTYEGYRQHFNGSLGFGFTTNIDVVEIVNVPAFALDGFYLENVLDNVLGLFPTNRKPNLIFIHKLAKKRAHRQVQNTVNQGDGAQRIVSTTATGQQGMVMSGHYDGEEVIPFVLSDILPKQSGVKTVTAKTQTEAYDEIHENASVSA